MAAETWVSEESRLTTVALRVFARALRRPLLVVGLALLAAGAYAAARALKPPSYEATLYFRLDEGDLADASNAPRPPRAIREYISTVGLSRRRLGELMQKHRVSPAYLARDPVGAIDAFREDLEVGVERNYFIYDRRRGDAPRSAQMTIALSGSDAEQTRAIVHDLGEAILRDQAAQRGAHLAQARELLGAQLMLARARATSLQREISRLSLDAAKRDSARGVAARARLAALEAEAQGAVEQVIAVERRAASVAFSAAAEHERLGLRFELYDEALATFAPHLTPLRLLLHAAVVFLVVLFLATPVVGAFDDRLYAPEDLAARGLPIFGALPRFPGDDAGSYRARLAQERA